MKVPRTPSGDSERGRWRWPIDMTLYDRTTTLSTRESDELAILMRYRAHANRFPQLSAELALQRLVRPLQDVLAFTQVPPRLSCCVLSMFLQEMDHLQAPFWAWPLDHRIGFIGANHAAFAQHRRGNSSGRQYLMAVAYLLTNLTDVTVFGPVEYQTLATKVFGPAPVRAAEDQVAGVLLQWGYSARHVALTAQTLAKIFLANRSPYLAALTPEGLEAIRQRNGTVGRRRDFVAISRALVGLGMFTTALSPFANAGIDKPRLYPEGVDPEWLAWCQRWRETTTLAKISRDGTYHKVMKVGRWLHLEHPEMRTPADWTRDLAQAFVAAVDRTAVGEWAPTAHAFPVGQKGKPLTPRTKAHLTSALRRFFRDCQEWEWMPRRFDPGRSLRTPTSWRRLIGPDPRVIPDDLWAKLLWAGLTLREDDVPTGRVVAGPGKHEGSSWYPLEMMRAMALVWLFCGLRSDEFCRLRVGCIRWQREGNLLDGADTGVPKDAICLLEVPVNKTSTAFVKPVDLIVGEAIREWERVRPSQPLALDRKTSQWVSYLFSYRGYQVGHEYINNRLIPMLCQRAGVPTHDARGDLTSHRARSTIASQLANAREPMTLLELQAWLGHRSPDATQHYVKMAPTKLARAFADAGYFGRNVRSIEILIDQACVKSGAAACGEPWRFYDLGHGYCTYEFFDQCPHRMVCAKCAFYLPKASSRAQLLEAQGNLLRMRQEMPLSDEEASAVDDGLTALDALCAKLVDIPTPAGPTPRELGQHPVRDVLPMLPSGAPRRHTPPAGD